MEKPIRRLNTRRGPEAICQLCGKSFRAWNNQQLPRFCSLSCSSRHNRIVNPMKGAPRGPRITCTCEWCGALFERVPSQSRKARFCSGRCKGSHLSSLKSTVICVVCTTPFQVNIHNAKTAKYCSSTCHRKAVPKPLQRSRSIRSKIMKSGRPLQCARCGYQEHPGILQAHHIDRNRTNDADDNIELICPNCHALEHRHHTK